MFVGRERELNKLNAMYQSEQFEFAVFYGRRRVGKTTLIREFIRDKEAVYYMAVEGTQRENLAGMSKALLTGVEGKRVTPEFADYGMLLDYIDEVARSGRRMIIVIDEFPYLAAAYPAISSMLQSHIDQCWKDSQLFLILCGSSMSFMETQVLGYKSPLYGRRTGQFKIHPFTFFEAGRMLENFSQEDRAILYGVTGGIPEYLARVNKKESVDENLIRLFFDENGRLFEEPENLLKQELREPMTYHSIIAAIAGGASRLNEIAVKTGLETSGCSNQIASLIALGIVKKETPVSESAASRRTLYGLNDNMFLFWYRFVRPNTSSIICGVGENIYQVTVKPQMNDFMGKVFEEICRQYLYLPKIYETLPFPMGNIGRWWGNNPKEKRQEEIDIMSEQDNSALFGECKWRNEPLDMETVYTLLRRGELFHYEQKYYYLFSKSGFTQAVSDYVATKTEINLISFDEMR